MGLTLRRFARVLRYVATSRELFFVGVLGHMDGVSCKASAIPNQAALLWHQARHFPRHELVRHRVLGMRVQLVRVRNVPSPAGVVVTDTSRHGLQSRLPGHERVTVSVLFASHRRVAGNSVDLEHCVVVTVDRGIKTQTEQVLMMMCVDAGVHLGAVGRSRLTRCECVGRENTGKLDLKLDDTILVHDPVDAVLVVARGEDLANDQLASTSSGRRLVAEVSVLEQNSIVFFVDADCVLDRVRFAVPVSDMSVSLVVNISAESDSLSDKRSVQVLDRALAIATIREWVGHVACTILAQVKGVFTVMRMVGVAIWHDHFSERDAPEHLRVRQPCYLES
jgi:hypothetical protein